MAPSAASLLDITLANGVRMPAVGLGTFQIKDRADVLNSVSSAIAHGYRLIDTASVYRNEAYIAEATSEAKVDRKSLFITSKLAPVDHGTEKATRAIEKTLAALKTDYLDLYLIHWPGVQGLDVQDERVRNLRMESWRVLEDYHHRGVLKCIGVSNYEVRHLAEVIAQCKVKPQVNQIELHPQYQNREVVEFCQKNSIHITAYSSLGKGSASLLEDPTVMKVAESCGKSPAQVLLKWALNKGYSVLPKSVNDARIKLNIELDFELNEKDMDTLDTMDTTEQYAWNPRTVI